MLRLNEIIGHRVNHVGILNTGIMNHKRNHYLQRHLYNITYIIIRLIKFQHRMDNYLRSLINVNQRNNTLFTIDCKIIDRQNLLSELSILYTKNYIFPENPSLIPLERPFLIDRHSSFIHFINFHLKL